MNRSVVVWLDESSATRYRLRAGTIEEESVSHDRLTELASHDRSTGADWRIVIDSRQETWGYHAIQDLHGRELRAALAALKRTLHPPPSIHYATAISAGLWLIAALESPILVPLITSLSATGVPIAVSSPLLLSAQLDRWLGQGKGRTGINNRHEPRVLLWRGGSAGWRLALIRNGRVVAARQVETAGEMMPSGFISETTAYLTRQEVIKEPLPSPLLVGLGNGCTLPDEEWIGHRRSEWRQENRTGDQLLVAMLLEQPIRGDCYYRSRREWRSRQPLVPLIASALLATINGHLLERLALAAETKLESEVSRPVVASRNVEVAPSLIGAVTAGESLIGHSGQSPWRIATPLTTIGRTLADHPSLLKQLQLVSLGWQREGAAWWIVMVWQRTPADPFSGKGADAALRSLARLVGSLSDGEIEVVESDHAGTPAWRIAFQLNDSHGANNAS